MTQSPTAQTDGSTIRVLKAAPAGSENVLSNSALTMLSQLGQRYRKPVDDVLAARMRTQKQLDAGQVPDFPA
ncbi:MAG: hypothetical protein AAF446_08750 [Pseudomonadota bacterium]